MYCRVPLMASARRSVISSSGIRSSRSARASGVGACMGAFLGGELLAVAGGGGVDENGADPDELGLRSAFADALLPPVAAAPMRGALRTVLGFVLARR